MNDAIRQASRAFKRCVSIPNDSPRAKRLRKVAWKRLYRLRKLTNDPFVERGIEFFDLWWQRNQSW